MDKNDYSSMRFVVGACFGGGLALVIQVINLLHLNPFIK